MEASYQAQLQQLQSSLSRVGDKQAKQFEMLEREHAQVGRRGAQACIITAAPTRMCWVNRSLAHAGNAGGGTGCKS